MMKKVVGGALIAMLAGCGGGAAAEGAVEVPAEFQGPVQSTDTARGEQVFTDVCGVCHMGGGAPDLTAESHPAAQIRMIVRQGTGTMPPLSGSQVSDEDLEAVLAYMTTIQAAH